MVSDDTESRLYAVIGRAIADPEFRERLMGDENRQAEALAEHGLEWNEDVRAGLTNAKSSIDGLNTAFGINSIAS